MKTIAYFVFRFTGRTISTRSLCRHLGALERDGWITRQRRHKTGSDGALELHSTLYVMTARTVKFCRSTGIKLWITSVSVAKDLIHIALPAVAETLARDHHSNYRRPPQGPPKKRAKR
jgi:hypothetical protein